MIIKELNLAVKGPFWQLLEAEVEGINVLPKMDIKDGMATLMVNDFKVPFDGKIEAFLTIAAPYASRFVVTMTGKVNLDNGVTKPFRYSHDYEARHGKLRVVIHKVLSEIFV